MLYWSQMRLILSEVPLRYGMVMAGVGLLGEEGVCSSGVGDAATSLGFMVFVTMETNLFG